jgi:hypothetical protein
MRSITQSAWFGYLLTAVLCVAVVYGVYKYYSVVYMPMHDDCEARGGIIVYDAMNVPTCFTGGAVIINPDRRRF